MLAVPQQLTTSPNTHRACFPQLTLRSFSSPFPTTCCSANSTRVLVFAAHRITAVASVVGDSAHLLHTFLLRPRVMSAPKRARSSEPAQGLVLLDDPLLGQFPPSTSAWRTLLPELLLHAFTFLLGSCQHHTGANFRVLFNLSSICSQWRAVVNGDEGGTAHMDLWAQIASVTAYQSHRLTTFQIVGDEGEDPSNPVENLSAAVTSLRRVRALKLVFSAPRERWLADIVNSDAPAVLDSLRLYTRLTALDLDMVNFGFNYGPRRNELRAAQRALDTTLAALASRSPNSLKSLSLHFPQILRPSDDTSLRPLCSSVVELSLSASELLLMARGNDPYSERMWTAHSVQTFVLPEQAQAHYLDNDLVVTTLSTALPSCTHFRVEGRYVNPAEVAKLLQQPLGGRLTFFQCTAPIISGLPSLGASCSALASLTITDTESDELRGDKINNIYACLASCASLTELSVVNSGWAVQFDIPAYLIPLPQLEFLHVHADRIIVKDGQPLDSLLTPNLTHIALALRESQLMPLTSLLQSISAFRQQRLPHLTHVYVDCNEEGYGKEWRRAVRGLMEEPGAVWCEREDDVVRWRADRLWKRSVGLLDVVEWCGWNVARLSTAEEAHVGVLVGLWRHEVGGRLQRGWLVVLLAVAAFPLLVNTAAEWRLVTHLHVHVGARRDAKRGVLIVGYVHLLVILAVWTTRWRPTNLFTVRRELNQLSRQVSTINAIHHAVPCNTHRGQATQQLNVEVL